MSCWICGSVADSREHTFKASDLRQYFGKISPGRPIYMHKGDNRNIQLKSSKTKKLTSKTLICSNCNNKLTQPYDYAWEELSHYLLKNWKPISKSNKFNLSKVFPGASREKALNIHLFFVKIFGCMILEGKIPIDIKPFSDALLHRKAHNGVYLTVAEAPFDKSTKLAGTTDIHSLGNENFSEAAAWMYLFTPVSIRVGFIAENSSQKVWPNAWHPSKTSKYVKLGNYHIIENET